MQNYIVKKMILLSYYYIGMIIIDYFVFINKYIYK